jgi:hypothetical protein
MPILSNCPACGAQIGVSEAGGRVTCPYCGNHFMVNMDSTQPEFRLAKPGEDVVQAASFEEETAEAYAADHSPDSSALYTQVDSSYVPPAQDFGQQIFTTVSRAASFPWRRWGLIGIAVLTVVFCLACACMFVIIQRVIR